MQKNWISLGLMSGTSGDGVDASIIETDGISNYKVIKNKYFYGVLLKNYRNRFLQKVNFKNSDIRLINFIELHTCNLLLTKI